MAREPVAYILGRKGFRHIELASTGARSSRGPRPSCWSRWRRSSPPARACTTWAPAPASIALALLDERPDLEVTASEPYAPAAEVARENAARLGLPLEVHGRVRPPRGEYDLIVANLPYVRDGDWEGLQPEIRGYEPREAFVSGADGLDAIRELIAAARSGTQIALEHGNEQGDAVRELLDDAALLPGSVHLGANHGRPRALMRPPA